MVLLVPLNLITRSVVARIRDTQIATLSPSCQLWEGQIITTQNYDLVPYAHSSL